MEVRSQVTIGCIFILRLGRELILGMGHGNYSRLSRWAGSNMLRDFAIQISYTARIKRAHSDNFNVLLNIYKMNPLKHSDVFKKFSNQILLPRPDGRHDENPNSYESVKEKGIFKSAKPTLDTNDYQHTNITNNTKAIHSKDNDVVNLLDDSINETNTVSIIKEKKAHNHLFNDENQDLNKFNEINNQDADTIIM